MSDHKAEYWCQEFHRIERELDELKQKINECWQLAYPESPPDDKDVAKMRIFNLYQDLKCTRDNLKFLSNA